MSIILGMLYYSTCIALLVFLAVRLMGGFRKCESCGSVTAIRSSGLVPAPTHSRELVWVVDVWCPKCRFRNRTYL